MIEHLIGGKRVASREAFETVNPATQEVLAEVAAGGEAEIAAAVEAAKAAFPKWAGTPQATRAQIMRKLGDLIGQHVPEISDARDQGHRPGHRPDEEGAGAARGGQLLLFRRGVHAHGRAHLSRRRQDAELHALPAGGRVRADLAVERAVHDRDVEGRAVPRARQHRRAEDVRALAAHRDALGRAGARGRRPARRAERRARLRQDRRRRADPTSRRARDLVHRRDRHREPDRAARRAQEVLDGARRQVAVRRVRRRRPRTRDGRRGVHDLLEQRRALHRRVADPRPAHDPRPVRRDVRGARGASRRRRPARREDDHRAADLQGASREGAALHRARPDGGRDPAHRRPRCARRYPPRCAKATS